MKAKNHSRTKKEIKQKTTDRTVKKYTVDEVLLTYSSWIAMKKRCNGKSKNPNDKFYIEEGISVSSSWEDDFYKFIEDLGPRPSILHTLDRYPNKRGHYEPGNVRWSDKKEQAINRRSTRFLTFNGQTETTSTWAKITGISRSTIQRRIDEGWSVELALTVPVKLKMVRRRSKNGQEVA